MPKGVEHACPIACSNLSSRHRYFASHLLQPLAIGFEGKPIRFV